MCQILLLCLSFLVAFAFRDECIAVKLKKKHSPAQPLSDTCTHAGKCSFGFVVVMLYDSSLSNC